MATDGYTLALLSFGDARRMKPTDFDAYADRVPTSARQAPKGFDTSHDYMPPRWGRQVAEAERNLLPEHVPAKRLSFEASYLARLGMVEKAAVARAKTQLPKGLDRFEKSRWLQANLGGCFVTMVPGAEEEGGRPLGLYWSASSNHASWKGVIMPRKL